MGSGPSVIVMNNYFSVLQAQKLHDWVNGIYMNNYLPAMNGKSRQMPCRKLRNQSKRTGCYRRPDAVDIYGKYVYVTTVFSGV